MKKAKLFAISNSLPNLKFIFLKFWVISITQIGVSFALINKAIPKFNLYVKQKAPKT